MWGEGVTDAGRLRFLGSCGRSPGRPSSGRITRLKCLMKCLQISIDRCQPGLMGESLVVLAKETSELTQICKQGLFNRFSGQENQM